MRLFRRRYQHRDEHCVPVMEPCEPRILFSADLLPIGAATSQAEHLAVEISGNVSTPAQVGIAVSSQQTEARRHELVIVDVNTPDRDRLVDQLLNNLDDQRDIEVLILDADNSGIAQITNLLGQYEDLDAVHLISHGSEGSVAIGNNALNFDSLRRYGGQIQSWGDALGENADLLIYGCDLAANTQGQGLVNGLAKLTGADVAASTDKTGASELGGDWDLEYHTGEIETAIALSESIRADFKAVLATFTVTSTSDSGGGSLRDAINQANLAAGADEIVFSIAGAGVHTINLFSALPTITDQILIDGWSEPDYVSAPVVELNGGGVGGFTDGIRLGFSSDGSTIRGLTINRFTDAGIAILGSDNHTIHGNWIGLDSTGTTPLANLDGIYAFNSNGNQIGGTTAAERNVISGNEHGVHFDNVTASTISGNYLGTDLTGTQDVTGAGSGPQSGLYISGGSGNVIGGDSAALRNVISGNNWFGIELVDSATNTAIQGNYIGTDVTGQNALGNTQGGISFYSSSSGNTVGGGAVGEGNVISGNFGTGIFIADGASTNKVQGNIIGLAADGVSALGNSLEGIDLRSDGSPQFVTGNLIGTDGDGSNDVGERNIISANLNGIQFFDSEVTGNTVAGNYVGTDASGTLDRGNSFNGIRIVNGASVNFVGGTLAAERNVIAGNNSYGLEIAGSGSNSNLVLGNYIGTDASGTSALGNTPGGIRIAVQASGNFIGGSAPGSGNVISGNIGDGVFITDSGTSANTIRGNFIGTDATGTGALANTDRGIQIESNADGTQIGGTVAGAGNVISGNGSGGVLLSTGTTGSVLEGNFIGTDLSATQSLGNTFGVRLSNSAGNRIGGIAAGAGNTIANNSLSGINIGNGLSVSNSVLGNSINSNGSVGIDLQNDGVTANDPGDIDTGPNNLQNFPTLSSAVSVGGNTTVNATLQSNASTSYRVEFFSSPTGDVSGHGEGSVFLGGTTVLTDAAGVISFTTFIGGASVTAGHQISATATEDLGGGNFGSTSEFGPTVTVVGNVPPSVTATSGALTYTENDVATAIDTGIAVVDTDSPNLVGAIVSISGGFVSGEDVLTFSNQLGISGLWNAGSGILTLSGSSTVANYQTALRSVAYSNTSDVPNTTARTISFIVNDGTDDSNEATRVVNVASVNDEPVNTVPAVQTVAEETASAINGVSINDADDQGLNLTTRVQVTNGVLNVTLAGGATISSGSNGSADMTILGSESDIDSTLASLMYTGNADVTGTAADTLRVSTSDLGNSGSGGALLDIDTIQIDVTAVNDAPVNTVPGIQSVNEEETLAIIGVSISDADDLGANLTTRLQVSNGVINVTLAGSATVSSGALGSADLTLLGSEADINATLVSLSYTGNDDVTGSGADTLTVTTNDQGNTGAGGAQQDVDTVQIDINEVNDGPVNTVPATISVLEETATAIGSVSIDDRDDLGANLTTRLQVSNGVLNVVLVGGATFSSGSNGSSDLTILGSEVDINATLASLTYTGNTEVNGVGADTFFITTNDLGNTGIGGAQASTNTVQIDITAINDNNPVITSDGGGATAALSVVENTTAVTTVTATDLDLPTETLTYSIVGTSSGGAADAAFFGINGTTGALTFSAAPDFEVAADAGANNVYDVTVQASDGTRSDTQVISVSVTNANEAPSGVSNLGGMSEDGWAPLTPAFIGFSDPDAGDTLAAVRIESLPTNGTLTLSGVAVTVNQIVSVADLNAFNLRYAPPADANGVGYASFDFRVQDNNGMFSASSNTATYNVNPVNDAPVNTVPSTRLVNEETVTAIGVFSVSDVDDPAANLTTRLQVNNGVLNVTLAGGATMSAGANATGDLTILGIQADINATLISLTYTGNTDVTGTAADTLTVTTDDLGNTGAGGPLQDVSTVQIDIAATNDAPVNTVPGVQTVSEEVATAIAGISVADIDALGANLTTRLQVSNGLLNVTLAGSASVLSGTNGSADFTILGSESDINATLASLTYTGATDVSGIAADSLTITTNDQGNTGSGGALQDVDTVQIDIAAVNDAPTITSNGGGATASITSPENVLAVTTVTAVDADLPAQALTYGISGGADAARFVIDPVTGGLSFQQTPNYEAATDSNSDGIYEVIVSASDGSLTTTQAMLVDLSDVNEAPTSIMPGQATVPETQASGSQVASLVGVDPDTGDVLTYTLVNDSAGLFQLNSTSGELGLRADSSLNFVNQNQHNLLVRVTDSSGLTFEQVIVINVTQTQGSELSTVTPPMQEATSEDESIVNELNPSSPDEQVTEESSDETTAQVVPDIPVDDSSPVFEFSAPDIPRYVPDLAMDSLVPVLTTARNVSSGDPSDLELTFEWVLLPNNNQSFDSELEPLATRRVTVSFENPDRGIDDEQAESFLDLALDPVRLASSLLSVGAVWWLTRSGGLITAMLMGIPTWRHLDLLPIVAKSLGDEEKANDGVGDVFELDPQALFSETVAEAMFDGRRSVRGSGQ